MNLIHHFGIINVENKRTIFIIVVIIVIIIIIVVVIVVVVVLLCFLGLGVWV